MRTDANAYFLILLIILLVFIARPAWLQYYFATPPEVFIALPGNILQNSYIILASIWPVCV